MTISADTDFVSDTYTGNGVTDVFAFPFQIYDDVDLLVEVKDTSDVVTTYVLTTDYTVSPTGGTYPAAGTITLTTPLPTDYELIIRPNIELSQKRAFTNQSRLSLAQVEDGLDKLTSMVRMVFNRVVDGFSQNGFGVATLAASMAITGNLSVAGNITVGGTVDGRDIAADGAYLDSIDAGTKFESRAAAEAGSVASNVYFLKVKTADGFWLDYARNTKGTSYAALTTVDGKEWMPAVPWMVTPDHFASNTTPGTTAMSSAILAAIAFAKEINGATSPYYAGAAVRFWPTRYYVDSQVLISDHGIHLEGIGMDNGCQLIVKSKTLEAIVFQPPDPTGAGAVAADKLLEGGGVRNLQFWNTTLEATANVALVLDRAARVQVQNCGFTHFYCGIDMRGVGENCTVESCNFTAGAQQSSLKSGSCAIRIGRRLVVSGGTTDAADGLDYLLSSTVGIYQINAVATTNGWDSCIMIEALDGLEMVGGHTNGADTACIEVCPRQTNIGCTSLHITGHHIDPKPANTNDGVRVSARYVGAYSGATAGGDLTLTGCGISGAEGNGINVTAQFKRINMIGGYIKSSDASHIILNHANAEDCVFDGVLLFTSDNDGVGTVPAINLVAADSPTFLNMGMRTGSRGLEVACTAVSNLTFEARMQGFTEVPIYLKGTIPDGYDIRRCFNAPVKTVTPSTANAELSPGYDIFDVDASAAGMAIIRDANFGGAPPKSNCAWNMRRITVRATATFTLHDYSDTTALAGRNISTFDGRNFAMVSGDEIVLEYRSATGYWHEISRIGQNAGVMHHAATVNNTTSDLVSDWPTDDGDVHEWTCWQKSSTGVLQGRWRVTVHRDGSTITSIVEETTDSSGQANITVTDNGDNTYTINAVNSTADNKDFMARFDTEQSWAS